MRAGSTPPPPHSAEGRSRGGQPTLPARSPACRRVSSGILVARALVVLLGHFASAGGTQASAVAFAPPARPPVAHSGAFLRHPYLVAPSSSGKLCPSSGRATLPTMLGSRTGRRGRTALAFGLASIFSSLPGSAGMARSLDSSKSQTSLGKPIPQSSTMHPSGVKYGSRVLRFGSLPAHPHPFACIPRLGARAKGR